MKKDEKIQFVSARFGMKGEAITIRLLCRIYRNGYYLDWNDDMALLFAKGVGDGVQHSCVNDVVYELLKRGFFDKSIFERFSILTSRGIQKRYFEATVRRKKVIVNPDFLLIDTSCYQNIVLCKHDVYNSGQNANNSEKIADIFQQSKVKESKVKKTKEDHGVSSEPPFSDFQKQALELSELLLISHRAEIPDYLSGKDKSVIPKWAADIEKLIRIDNKSPERIRQVILWVKTKGNFWFANIQSGKKLRERYETLWAQMQTKSKVSPPKIAADEISDDRLDSYFKLGGNYADS